jgi:3-hydroxybutyryl-CoA dehydrogenase
MTVTKVGIVGAGTMGSGIATNIAQHGFPVRLVDMSQEMIDAALAKARAFYAKQVERGRMSAADAAAAGDGLTGGTELAPLADCDLVIEAVFERIDIKAELYGKLNGILRADAILATNTSCLRVGALAEPVDRPERFLGLHYFNPPAINPIVEVVRGDATAPATVEAALAFCAATGKQAVSCRDSSGFALNRFFCPYVNEAVRLFDDGMGTPFEIDRVACDVFGAAAGPFVVINLVGSQVLLHAQDNLRPLGDFYTPAASVERVGQAKGQWEIGDPSPPDGDRDRAIAERLMGATFLPVLQELDEKVASPGDIDMGATLALKFGKPPCAVMDALGGDEVARLIEVPCRRYGAAPPKSLKRVGQLVA